jgi:hypothetical protein
MLRLVRGLGHGIHHQVGAQESEPVAFVARKGMGCAVAAMAHVLVSQGGQTIARRATSEPSTVPGRVRLEVWRHDPGHVRQGAAQGRLLGCRPAVLVHPSDQGFGLISQPLSPGLARLWVIPVTIERGFHARLSQHRHPRLLPDDLWRQPCPLARQHHQLVHGAP